ncbi:hypothetical protein GGI15_002254 [Coemansia interrupta]|uniref:SHSP domain-containing protein n=1 Tax=Coemansia interrupta TaxID=1126814 RepID=A0A9W8HLM0_9FUNG|nr:hypothetical protein GGI15_002254 [Coemansia interrupta]
MSRRVTNFDYEIYSADSGFQSVRASTLPGRMAGQDSPWCTGSFARFHGHPFGAHTLDHATHFQPFYHGGPRRPPMPSIMDTGFFAPPPLPPLPSAGAADERPQVEELADRRVVRLRNAVFRDARPSVQVKGGVLRVAAVAARETGGLQEDCRFEYSTTLGPAYDVRRITASRSGDTLTLTIPRRK